MADIRFLLSAIVFCMISFLCYGQIQNITYKSIDKSTFLLYTDHWKSTHERWIHLESNDKNVVCNKNTHDTLILPVCIDNKMIDTPLTNNDKSCPKSICYSSSSSYSCVPTPGDVTDYLPPPKSTSKDKKNICTPPSEDAYIYQSYYLNDHKTISTNITSRNSMFIPTTNINNERKKLYYSFDGGLPPDYRMQTAIKLIIKGKVYGSVGDNHRDSSRTTCNNNTIAKAEIDAWQVDVRSLETTNNNDIHTNSDDKIETNTGLLREKSCRGTILTNNDGTFEFITTIPPSYGPPRHISYTVTAPGYQTLTSRIYFMEDLRMKQLVTKYDSFYKNENDDDATLPADSFYDSETNSYPDIYSQDPRFLKDVKFKFTNPAIDYKSTNTYVQGYFEGNYDIILQPLRDSEKINTNTDLNGHPESSSITPYDLSGMWMDNNGGIIKVENQGYTFIAAEYPHTRSWGTIIGYLRGDVISGVNFRRYLLNKELKDGSVSRHQVSLDGIENEDEWDSTNTLGNEATKARPSAASNTLFSKDTTTGVISSQDSFVTARNDAMIVWKGGNIDTYWRRITTHDEGYRYLKVTITRETGGYDGGELHLNEIEFYEGYMAQNKIPLFGFEMTSSFTPEPLRVSCSSYKSQIEHCFKAFDGDKTSKSVWVTDPVGSRRHELETPQWILLDLGEGRGILPTALRMICDQENLENPKGCPMTFILEGSNDMIRYDMLYSNDLYDYKYEYASNVTNNGILFNFFWESPVGRAHGHRCGSCDSYPLFTCAYSAYDGTCASRHCSEKGVCDVIPSCKAGEYLAPPEEAAVVYHSRPRFECRPCPAGRYGSVSGLLSPSCSGSCKAGYWCGEGSTDPMQNKCGSGSLNMDNRGVFCPEGSAAPIQAASGRRTVSNKNFSLIKSFPDADEDTMISDQPCSKGHYCINGVQHPCPAGRFGNRESLTTSYCDGNCLPGTYCPIMSILPTICPKGHFCPDGYTRHACSPGLYGGSTGLKGADCSGYCAPGYYCEKASTSIQQNKCPPGRYGGSSGLRDDACSGYCLGGYYCPEDEINTNSTSLVCGSLDVYCPRGSSKPITVQRGYYSIQGLKDRRSNEAICPIGYFCVHGEKFPCPAGTYGDQNGLWYHFKPYDTFNGKYEDTGGSFVCSGLCPKGHYCLQNTTSATAFPCPAGRYGSTIGLRNDSCTMACPFGHYCPSGTSNPIPCPAGTFGNTTGLTSKECRNDCEGDICQPNYCQEGYYCPEGSRYSGERECGHAGVYCPTGSKIPITVDIGYYSIGPLPIERDDDKKRVDQIQCPRGSFCVNGVKRLCPPGTYGVTTGLSSESCTDLCPLGHYCPEGTINGTLYRCPAGRYGDVFGLTDTSCSGVCDAGWYCPEGSISPTERQCGRDVTSLRNWRPEPRLNEIDVIDGAFNAVFCPEGSAAPVTVLPGYYSSGGNRTTRSSQLECKPGSYCVDGIVYTCPAGRYGRSYQLQHESCTGACQKGHFCPAGSISMNERPCPIGRYGDVEGLKNESCTGSCPNILDCPIGSVLPQKLVTNKENW